MPEAIGGIVGGLFGGGSGGGSQQTATKEPWSEAAPWLRQIIQDGQDLQGYYQQNPFNQIQQTGYQNLLGDLDSFRSGVAPGLMNFANNLMGTNYQRAAAGTELGASNPYASQAMLPAMLQKTGNQQAAGLLPQGLLQGVQSGQGMAGGAQQGGGPGFLGGSMWNGSTAVPNDTPVTAMSLLADPEYGRATGRSQGQVGAFSAAPGQSYGLLDWTALNPWTNQLRPGEKTPVAEAENTLTNDQIIEDYLRRRDPQAWQEWDSSRRLGQGGA